MASTTIARRGFAGLYFLSIDGLAEARERRASLDAFTGAFPAGLRMEVSSNRCVKHTASRKPSLPKKTYLPTCFQLCQRTPSDSLLQSSSLFDSSSVCKT